MMSHSWWVCDLFRHHLGWKVFVIRLLYRICKEKLKFQGHHPFKLSFGFTTTCIMIISGTNYSRNGGQNNWFLGILPVYSLMFIIMWK